ncbi:hypothetical protein CDAR_188981 [Caerostris darwini]|uniref:Uncharacterized protein n=1 Tax=Caerostris darwini TaxID=1538125 RepID=A0AAV4QTU0_9ARAC|nr:hypothetical protein CDAR_188981 [Caerostris darwini]
MEEFDFTEFLGKPVVFNACPNYANINNLCELGMAIMCSPPAPWQRIDALKALFFLVTQFAMRTAQFKKTDWDASERAENSLCQSLLQMNTFMDIASMAAWGFRSLQKNQTST